MGLRLPGQEDKDCFFVTTSFLDHRRLGELPGVYEVLADSLLFYSQRESVRIAGYVFMPSHIHLLMMVDGNRLGAMMRDFKAFSSKKLGEKIGSGTQWESRYDRVVIETLHVFQTKLNYIHDNPVKAGLCEKPEEWLWSSAANYATETRGLIPVWKDWW